MQRDCLSKPDVHVLRLPPLSGSPRKKRDRNTPTSQLGAPWRRGEVRGKWSRAAETKDHMRLRETAKGLGFSLGGSGCRRALRVSSAVSSPQIHQQNCSTPKCQDPQRLGSAQHLSDLCPEGLGGPSPSPSGLRQPFPKGKCWVRTGKLDTGHLPFFSAPQLFAYSRPRLEFLGSLPPSDPLRRWHSFWGPQDPKEDTNHESRSHPPPTTSLFLGAFSLL